MKNVGLFVFLILILFTVTTGCDFSSKDKSSFYASTKSTDLGAENVESIALNSEEKEVKKTFGEPNFVEQVSTPKSSYYIYGHQKNQYDINITLVDGKVSRVHMGSNKYKTARGIAIGSTRESVIQAYGDSFYKRLDTGTEIIGYFDKMNSTNLEFGISDNVVLTIILSKYTPSK